MNFLYPLLVVLLAGIAAAPLEYPGAIQSHTGLLAVYNLINLDLHPLQFLGWAPSVGTTYDVLRGEGPLPYLAAEIFHLIGLGYLDSVKLVYAVAWMVSGLTMYILARRFVSQAGALLAGTIYVFLPFHIATIYVRGAFAEAFAWAIFPLALLAVVTISASDRRREIAQSLLPFALLFLTQPGLAILFSISAFAIGAAMRWRTQTWVRPVLTAILGGLALGMVVDLPTMVRYGFYVAPAGFVRNFPMPFQLLSSAWGFGQSTSVFPPAAPPSVQGPWPDPFPFQIGIVPLGLAIVALGLVVRNKHLGGLDPSVRRFAIVMLVAALGLTLLTFEIAAPIWNVFGLFAIYPWQVLAFVGLALALAGGAVIDLDLGFANPPMLAVMVALAVLASYGYLAPRYDDFSPTRPQIAVFGDNEIALLDYRIVGPLRHGATVRVQMQWQALRQIDHDYTVFVHAVNDDGNTYAQEDSKPREGTSPTLRWVPGQVISDTHTIQIDVEGPREGYHLEVGLYQAANGRRAITDTGSEELMLPRPGDPEPIISDQLPLASK